MMDYGFKEGFLEDGSVVIFPTDTVFGIGCMLYDDKAINRIYEIKSRDFEKKIAVLCENIVSVNNLAVIDERVLKIAHKFWPGPLTMILKAKDKYINQTGFNTVGIRIPNHRLTLNLIKQNGPIVATSVNISGKEPLVDLDSIIKHFENKVDYIFKEYQTKYLNVSSTIIDLTEDKIKYLRVGTISKEEIEDCLK